MRVGILERSSRKPAARIYRTCTNENGSRISIDMKACYLVRKGGLEPPRPYGRSHLKAVRLPISPLPRVSGVRCAISSPARVEVSPEPNSEQDAASDPEQSPRCYASPRSTKLSKSA
jgi:hypothetical protein